MSETKKLSNIINSIKELGEIIREQRKQQGLSQAEFAAICGVGNRFISDLENGKETIRFDKVLQVMQNLGLKLILELRAWPRR